MHSNKHKDMQWMIINKRTHICNKTRKETCIYKTLKILLPILYKTRKWDKQTYLNLQISLPLLSNHQQRGINKLKKNFSPFLSNQTRRMYMRYTLKLTPPAYMHYMKKRWLNLNHITHNIKCIKRDVKLPLHTCKT